MTNEYKLKSVSDKFKDVEKKVSYRFLTYIQDNNKDYNNTDKDLVAQSATAPKTNDLLDMFKTVNPSWERLFANTTQRAAMERMVKKHGSEKMVWLMKNLPAINRTKYAPTVTTPYQLEMKLASVS